VLVFNICIKQRALYFGDLGHWRVPDSNVKRYVTKLHENGLAFVNSRRGATYADVVALECGVCISCATEHKGSWRYATTWTCRRR
jgi:hypothetical protein